MMKAPLDGIRVVDLTIALAGPLATHMLGHFGADVIKVESPGGDIARGAGGPCRNPGMNPFVLHTSRCKRSVVLDLKHDLGRAALSRLLASADVFVHNLRPAAAARLGLAYETVAKLNPRLVYCAVVGFGSRGRYSGLPAYDDTVQGVIALPWLLQQMSGAAEPQMVPSAIVDRVSGITTFGQIVTALLARERQGTGQAIEIPMFETLAHFILSDHLFLRTFEPPLGPSGHFRLLDPNRRPYPTRDGHICVLPTHDKHWFSLFALAGRPEMKDDSRFCDVPSRMKHVRELYQFISDAMVTRTTNEWLVELRAADIPAMPMNSLDQLIEDPHLQDVGLLQTVEHPTEGRIVNIGLPGDWSSWEPDSGRQAPRLGEHSRKVLAEAGCDPATIAQMMELGVSVEPPGARAEQAS
jgi:crotonobetainyl-CoA:carnitine CoA-transferase CaiB-like acyl-CoA transferase